MEVASENVVKKCVLLRRFIRDRGIMKGINGRAAGGASRK